MTATRVDRTERLLNLVICLMAARIPVHRAQIRDRIPGYPPGDAAFERMFERDKDELRGMGIPIETVLDAHGDVLGYRIERSHAQLPAISVTANERAVLAVAATVWESTVAQSTAVLAARKFEAAAGDVDPAGVEDFDTSLIDAASLIPRLASHDAALIPLMAAIHRGQQVTFDYRTAGATEVMARLVEPWALVSDQGHWYVVGFDGERMDTRVFRLSRICGEVDLTDQAQTRSRPQDLDANRIRALLVPADPEGPTTATVQIKAGQAFQLRRLAVVPKGNTVEENTREEHEGSPERDTSVQVQGSSREGLLSMLCAAGDSVTVETPGDIRQDLVDSLVRIRDRHGMKH